MAIEYQTFVIPVGNPTTSFSVTIPTVLAGDILILDATHRGNADLSVSDDSGVGSWTKKENTVNTANLSGQLWWKRVTNAASESGASLSVSGATNSVSGILTQYRGCIASGDPIEAILSEANASANETQAEITALTAGAMICLAVHQTPDVNTTAQSCTTPGALTHRGEKLSTGGTDCSTSHASAIKSGTGATGAFTWSQTDTISVSRAYALKPASPQVVSPGTGISALAGFAPAVIINTIVSAGLGLLTLTGFAPTAAVGGGGTTVNPGTGEIVLSGAVPAIQLSDHKIILPGLGELTLTGFAPAIAVSDNKIITPGTGAVLASGFPAQITATNHKIVSAGTGQALFTGFAPVVIASDHKIILPGTGQTVLTGFAPQINIGVNVQSGTGQLSASGFAPVIAISNNIIISSNTGIASFTGFAPLITASNNISVNALTGQLAITGFAPSVITAGTGTLILSETGILSLTGFSPLLIVKSRAKLHVINILPRIVQHNRRIKYIYSNYKLTQKVIERKKTITIS